MGGGEALIEVEKGAVHLGGADWVPLGQQDGTEIELRDRVATVDSDGLFVVLLRLGKVALALCKDAEVVPHDLVIGIRTDRLEEIGVGLGQGPSRLLVQAHRHQTSHRGRRGASGRRRSTAAGADQHGEGERAWHQADALARGHRGRLAQTGDADATDIAWNRTHPLGDTPEMNQAPTRRAGGPRRWAFGAAGLLGMAFLCASCSSTSPSATADADVTKGLAAQAEGHLTEAMAQFQAATRANPNDKYAYYDEGVLFQQRNEIGNAITAYGQAIQIDPNYKPALWNLAVVNTPKDPVLAETFYQKLLTLNPNDPNVLFNLGLLLFGQGQSALGRLDVQRAITLNPQLAPRVPTGILPSSGATTTTTTPAQSQPTH